ncbi:hypothetical protein A2715_03280 [Candidatus Woesebacteria bacterium RIFCSPHIGHO2_01_FULL_39_32]|uniref:Haloacid dehalogenase n=1 Tax=Candidatus Woesebacteria bacterium RIFCSPLOWO2_01_FULL_39_25 TaxID=1802521 RepID=A0A1F8BKI6_9BACT|nr:MAG: hypothetical protein A2124_02770 [Candidatus Woesebacteria bacterium GWB1_37_5]OGM24761.1 MAG: hypothetical protein A2715_03280 [Candidatus Woesebacteria bacterium RIFCSPHIGHO2_01_FULL_39_32]OGM35710.1 MAG: hypothetical protein A3F01_06095 [Candidatus Woesebacteria bacterium RIFCSPHIGHO2_12_FULL_38_11]OGM64587.1 MAG: hypothetical protein A2893_06195 [Candidatus Woesebacteria bacterium RIFCSPLOWO2_01_FULL_39_25]
MNNVQNIVSDLGGVLLTDDDTGLVSKSTLTRKLLGVNQHDLESGWEKAWPDLKIGKISEEEFMRLFIGGVGKEPTEKLIKNLKEIWRKNVTDLPFLNQIKKLKGKYNLYLLTNIGNEWLAFKRTKFKLDDYFAGIVSSAQEGIAKPDPKIYSILINRFNINPGESLYVDDLERNIVAAEAFGFRTILFESLKDATTRLHVLNVEE